MRKFILAAVLCAIGAPAFAAGGANDRLPVKIPAQRLETALQALAQVRNLQVVCRTEVVGELRTQGVSGEFTQDEALRRLLNGTGLTFRYLDESTVTIVPVSGSAAIGADTPAAAAAARASRSGATFRLARAQTDTDSGATAAEAAARGEVDKVDEAQSLKGVPEILVRDRRSASTDIQRSEDDVQPYVVFTAEEIENSMAGDIESFLRTRLTMNQSASTATMEGGQRGGQSTIDLRGLGSDETLILVNGRRQPSVALASMMDVYQPDINGIPLSSIERIEVLPSTAGGIYGGGATGGVINVILKQGYQGLEVRGTYDGTTNGGNHKRRLEASGGLSLEGGRTSLNFGASYSDAVPLVVEDRDFTINTRRRILQNDPQSALYFFGVPSLGPAVGYTTNIRSVSGNPLVLAATGQSLGSALAHVPVGYAGPASDGGAAFLGTAGSFNTDLANDYFNDGLKKQLLAAPTIRSINLNLRREFTDRIEAFLDASNYDNRADSYFVGGQNGSRAIIEVGPNNPFTERVRIHLPQTNIDRDMGRQRSWNEVRNLAGGVIVRLPAGWSAQGEYAWNRSRSGYQNNFYQLTADGAAAIRDGRLDPFRDVNAYPLDFSPYYTSPTPQYNQTNDMILKTATLRLAGPVWRLPAGPLMLSTMVERRDEVAEAYVSTSYMRTGVPEYRYYPERGSATDSAYVEFTVPLVSARNKRPGILGLELQASYRHDSADISSVHFADFGAIIAAPEGPYSQNGTIDVRTDANQYTFGLRYQPVEQLALRASFGEGVLPPSLVQLSPIVFPPAFLSSEALRTFDPKRGGEPLLSLGQLVTGGSPTVRPEQSESVSAGLIFTPLTIPGLRMSLDYTRIDKRDEINRVDTQTLVALEDEGFSNRIVRGPLTPGDAALGYTAGPILEIDSGGVNIAKSLMEAVDAQVDYTWQTRHGAFKASLMGTYQSHLQQQILADQPTVDFAGTNLGPLKIRGNLGLTWTREAWALGWNMQYYHSYLITQPGWASSWVVQNGGNPIIPSQQYHDLFGMYRFGERAGAGWTGLLDNVELRVTVRNVLDTEPPILVGNSLGWFDVSPYGDPRLRSYVITLSKSFQ